MYASNAPGRPVWTGVSQYPGLAARQARAVGGSSQGANHAASLGFGMGSVETLGAAAAERGAENFPELAALEQQFQQQFSMDQQQQQQQQGLSGGAYQRASSLIAQPGEPVQEFAAIGTNGVLVASGLPASIQAPQTLVPVRLGVADSETVGTSPDASPVVVAIAAAEKQVRPLAVALPPGSVNPHRTSTTAGSAGPSWPGTTGVQGQEEAATSTEVQQALMPEPEALGWAERNIWFGADTEMTQLAYQVQVHLRRTDLNSLCLAADLAVDTLRCSSAVWTPSLMQQVDSALVRNMRCKVCDASWSMYAPHESCCCFRCLPHQHYCLQIHDSLVAQGVDPASDVYYAAIEAKVAEQMPDKWVQWQAIMSAAAGETRDKTCSRCCCQTSCCCGTAVGINAVERKYQEICCTVSPLYRSADTNTHIMLQAALL